MKDSGYFATLYYSKMNTTHNGKPKWCSTTPFKTCLEFTPGTNTTTTTNTTTESDQWIIFWNNDIDHGNETVFIAEAEDAKCPNEIAPNNWKFALCFERVIQSIKCDPTTTISPTISPTISTTSPTSSPTTSTTSPTTSTTSPTNSPTNSPT